MKSYSRKIYPDVDSCGAAERIPERPKETHFLSTTSEGIFLFLSEEEFEPLLYHLFSVVYNYV